MDEFEKPVGKPYRGHSGIARTSPWMTHEDFELKGINEANLAIDDVIGYRNLKFEGGRVKEVALSLKFRGWPKELVINQTIRKALNRLFTPQTDSWVGKTVNVFITQTRAQAGEMVKCLRIREAKGAAPSTASKAKAALEGPAKPATADSTDGAPPAAPRDAVDGGARADEASRPATDGDLWAELKRACDQVTATFHGERVLLKEAPPRSGVWFTADHALGDSTKVYDANTGTLAVSRELLAELLAKVQAL